jgi:hypothetical protein
MSHTLGHPLFLLLLSGPTNTMIALLSEIALLFLAKTSFREPGNEKK